MEWENGRALGYQKKKCEVDQSTKEALMATEGLGFNGKRFSKLAARECLGGQRSSGTERAE